MDIYERERAEISEAVVEHFGVSSELQAAILDHVDSMPRWNQIQVYMLLTWPDDSFDDDAKQWIRYVDH